MQYLLALSLLLIGLANSPVEWLQAATVTMSDTLLDDPVVYNFEFRNTTQDSITVENVRVGCGCTATEWQDTPVAPGATGSINVTYDATNVGYYRKYVKVFFRNHRGGHKLWMEGFVEGSE